MFHSFQNCFDKINISHVLIFSLSFSFFYCTLTAANMRDFDGNCTIAGEKFFLLNLTSSDSKVYYAIALKFSAKENNLIHDLRNNDY